MAEGEPQAVRQNHGLAHGTSGCSGLGLQVQPALSLHEHQSPGAGADATLCVPSLGSFSSVSAGEEAVTVPSSELPECQSRSSCQRLREIVRAQCCLWGDSPAQACVTSGR